MIGCIEVYVSDMKEWVHLLFSYWTKAEYISTNARAIYINAIVREIIIKSIIASMSIKMDCGK